MLPPQISHGVRAPRPTPLPQTFFVYDTHKRELVGAAVAEECAINRLNADSCFWKVARFVPLRVLVVVPTEAKRWINTIVHFHQDFEMEARRGETIVGGPLAGQFLEFAAHRWRAWPLGATALTQIRLAADGVPTTIATSIRVARAVKVSPDIVRFQKIFTKSETSTQIRKC